MEGGRLAVHHLSSPLGISSLQLAKQELHSRAHSSSPLPRPSIPRSPPRGPLCKLPSPLSIHHLLLCDPSPEQGSSWLGRGCPPPQGGDSGTAGVRDAPLTLRLGCHLQPHEGAALLLHSLGVCPRGGGLTRPERSPRSPAGPPPERAANGRLHSESAWPGRRTVSSARSSPARRGLADLRCSSSSRSPPLFPPPPRAASPPPRLGLEAPLSFLRRRSRRLPVPGGRGAGKPGPLG